MRLRMRLSSSAALVCGFAALTAASSALAQAPTAAAQPAAAKPTAAAPAKAAATPKPQSEFQKRAQAAKLAKDAEAKAKAGDYAAALPLWTQAEALAPASKQRLGIAVALDKTAKVVEAAAAYQAFLDGKPDAKKEKDAVAEAEARLAALKKTPAKLVIVTEPAAPPNAKLTLDGSPVQGAELSVAPGKHSLALTADGFEPATREFEATFAESKELKLTLAALPPPPAPVVATTEPGKAGEGEKPAEPPPAPVQRSKVPAYITLGLAGAGAIVGATFGGLALKAKSDFNAVGGATTANADKADRNALIADMAFAVALTFGVTGTVLLLGGDPPPEAKAALQHKPTPVRGFVTPYAGPTGGGAAAVLTF